MRLGLGLGSVVRVRVRVRVAAGTSRCHRAAARRGARRRCGGCPSRRCPLAGRRWLAARRPPGVRVRVRVGVGVGVRVRVRVRVRARSTATACGAMHGAMIVRHMARCMLRHTARYMVHGVRSHSAWHGVWQDARRCGTRLGAVRGAVRAWAGVYPTSCMLVMTRPAKAWCEKGMARRRSRSSSRSSWSSPG